MKRQGRTGRVISFEGIDGAGKTTASNLCCRFLDDMGIDVLAISEPGGTGVGSVVRRVTSEEGVSHHPWADALLFAAARAENVYSLIIPATAEGKWVVLDRFVDSTFAYQGYGQGLNLKYLEDIHNYSTDGFFPDLTILLDCPVNEAIKRVDNRVSKDRWEKLGIDFLERVRQGYLELAEKYRNRFVIFDAREPLSVIEGLLKNKIEEIIRKAG